MLSLLEDGKKLRLAKSLWVHYGGVEVADEGDALVLEGQDEDSYLKVLNHFGRVFKLYTFENHRWMDAETGGEPGVLDESLAGRVKPGGLVGTTGKTPPKDTRKSAKPATSLLAKGPRESPLPPQKRVTRALLNPAPRSERPQNRRKSPQGQNPESPSRTGKSI